uniref:Uncharacterized protein n=1 Tax=Rhizophora mucronata TaxID=61149 RepID=A0A2P2J499_RHIMU
MVSLTRLGTQYTSLWTMQHVQPLFSFNFGGWTACTFGSLSHLGPETMLNLQALGPDAHLFGSHQNRLS